jgi:mRNA-degrading endonuclease toxin of MazEF toxin-antitoxin module
MADILRGDIWWAELDPTRGREQAGTRPVLIISHDAFNARSGTVIALAITSQPQAAGFPLTLNSPRPDSRAVPGSKSARFAFSPSNASAEELAQFPLDN